ncbi:flagellar hook-length control protein FliK [Aestuariibacter halophilus]|uniref:Flagellar hook-length control protein FliK n=1 Tax=Fluctibacter halophilus TaxID=226011 RepID=A0ABS8G5K4_9ALTE|nr:flagellar hook-length control protein FliK [Aestuariibacter halophilus]MCC2615150.1 flagellar hook-length control protein FliK [Aestuariibacter halophilus]
MQQIATRTSQVAALPVSTDTLNTTGSSASREYEQQSSEHFREMLDMQRNRDRSPGNPVEPRPQRPERSAASESPAPDKQDAVQSSERDHTQKNHSDEKPVEAQQTDNATQAPAPKSNADKAEQDASVTPEETSTETDPSLVAETNGNDEALLNEASAVVSEEAQPDVELGVTVDWLTLLAQINGNIDKEQSAPQVQPDAVEMTLPELEGAISEQLNSLIQQLDSGETLTPEAQAELAGLMAQWAKQWLSQADNASGQDVQTELTDDLNGMLREALSALDLSADVEQASPLGAMLKDLLAQTALDGEQNTDQQQLGLFNAKPAEVSVKTNQSDPDGLLKTLAQLPKETRDNLITQVTAMLEKGDTTKVSDETAKGLANVVGQMNEQQQKQFLASLSAGLDEISAQRKQGHEPGIDLQALIGASLAKAGVEGELAIQQQAKAVEALTQVLERAQHAQHAMTQGMEHALNVVRQERHAPVSAMDAQMSASVDAQRQQAFDKAVALHKPEGAQQMADKVRWMVNAQNMQADIRLDPPELGSMKVRINVSGESATVNFVVQSQQAREVLEQATPRLKELLEEQGIQLGQSSVEQEQQGNEANEGQMAGGDGLGQGDDGLEEGAGMREQSIPRVHNGLIDYFV